MPPARSRWVLHLQAQMWRYLMGIGMLLHRLAPPRPPKPNFTRSIPATVSTKEGNFTLYFWCPPDYENNRKLGFKSKTGSKKRSPGYPCIINFHGGGFTLGDPRDDARWCGTVVEQCDAVVVSVDYRRAPENPFPTAVEDGVDAVLYIANHAAELGINPSKIALSGFSSGANMAFTVPLRLYDHMTEFSRTLTNDESNVSNSSMHNLTVPTPSGRPQTLAQMASASTSSVNRILRSRSATVVPQQSPDHYLAVRAAANNSKTAHAAAAEIPSVQLCAIVPWYPSCDYTQTREQRRSTTVRKDQELPALFTDLFDESYLHPPDTIPLDSPYLSPAIADTDLLAEALPEQIIMHTCEWDMLLAEGQKFHQRLISPEIGKKVVYKMVEGVPHGWDKAPNPLKPTPGVKEHYLRACKELRRVFREVDASDTRGRGVGRENNDAFGAGAMNQGLEESSGGSGSGSGSGTAVAGHGDSSDNISAISTVDGDGESFEMGEGDFARRGRRESKLVN